MVQPITGFLAIAAIAVVLSTVPYSLIGIEYRDRDNGLAYLLFVIGLGVWNAMFFAQLLSTDPQVKVFFLGLSVVGAVQSGLGWFLFASTASVSADIFRRRDVYAGVGILGGLDIIFAVSTPVHPFYWQPASIEAGIFGFAAVEPAIGYWLHTALLVGLYGAGTALFWIAWREDSDARYPRAYSLAGVATVLIIGGSNVLSPGGLGFSPLAAASLTTIGWFQASRGEPLAWLRSLK